MLERRSSIPGGDGNYRVVKGWCTRGSARRPPKDLAVVIVVLLLLVAVLLLLVLLENLYQFVLIWMALIMHVEASEPKQQRRWRVRGPWWWESIYCRNDSSPGEN